MHKLTI